MRRAHVGVKNRPLTTAALVEPSGSQAWTDIPSWAPVGIRDPVIPPAGEMSMAP